MFEFLFPWSMAAGGVLVASPILIHLINRMRFKRIRWAAMEFLLKAQKRNRRRLIIEQLILLLLRILLVLLAALIVARFIGAAFAESQKNRTHVVVLDDTFSMTDGWKDDREGPRTSFREGKRVIREEIGKHAALSSKAQQLKLIQVTKPDEVQFDKRLNDTTLRDLETTLGQIDCSLMHRDLLQSLKKARAELGKDAENDRVLYIVSDLRTQDWSGTNGAALEKELKEMIDLGINIRFVDVAHPARKETEKEANYHSNLAILQLRPELQTVGQGMPQTDFTVVVANYGPTVRNNVQVKVRHNGQAQLQASTPLPPIPAGGQVEGKFALYLDKVGLNQVVAYIEADDEGPTLDNERYAVVNVRDKVPVLVVDGDLVNSKKEPGDLYNMQVMFRPAFGLDLAPGLRLEEARPADLETRDLSQYPNIYLVNVPDLNEKAQKNLEAYVRQGGTVCYFMGALSKPDFYNKLYADGKGIFPVPLTDRPTAEMTLADREAREKRRAAKDLRLEVFIRDDKHKVFAPLFVDPETALYALASLPYLNIDRHFTVPRDKWQPKEGVSQELLTLPNEKSMEDYKKRTNELLAKIPQGDPRNQKFRDRLNYHREQVQRVLGGTSLYRLAGALEFMLNDTGDPDPKRRAERPNLKEFWDQDEVRRLGEDFNRLIETVRYGDPLLVEGKYGKGRTMVFLTSAGQGIPDGKGGMFGTGWNNWASMPTYPMFMAGMQRYLMSTSPGADLTIGSALDVELDPARYQGKVQKFFKPEKEGADAKPDGDPLGDDSLQLSGNGRFNFSFSEARKPGVYTFKFFPQPTKEVPNPVPDVRAFAFNLDTLAESNLLRSSREELLTRLEKDPDSKKPKAMLIPLGASSFGDLAGASPDLSMGPWLYLIFLLVLIAEQAMAVHLSFHLRGGQAAPPGQAVQPRPTTV